MPTDPDTDRWTITPTGYLLNPPRACPACGTVWRRQGPRRPHQDWVGCTCGVVAAGGGTLRPEHTVWICPSCGIWAAEACVDLTRWHQAPIGLPLDRRASVAPSGSGGVVRLHP